MAKIIIFSTPLCPFCYVLKNYLKEKGFVFEEVDVSKDEEKRKELIEKTGKLSLPVTEIDGQLVSGFDKKKIDQMLGIKD